MILETIEILDSNLEMTSEQLETKVANGDYDDLLNNYNLLIMISSGLVLINKEDKSCKVIAPADLDNYVKFNDYATPNKAGVVKYTNSFGIAVNTEGFIYTLAANENEIDLKTSARKPIVPSNLDYAVRSVYPITQTALSDPITVNTIYNLGLQTDIVIALPSGQLGDFIQVDFVSGTTATSLTVSSSNGIIGYDLTPEANNIYTLYFDWGVTACDTAGVQTYGWRCNYFEYAITLSQSSSGFEPEVT